VSEKKGTGFVRRNKFLFQSAALILMLIVPVLLYWAAQAGSEVGILTLLGLMGAAMALTMWVS
jgi:hypothetical protein